MTAAHSPQAHGCPRCGSDVLKSAPLPVVGSLLKPLIKKRRYRFLVVVALLLLRTWNASRPIEVPTGGW